ncbi:hypothetical protein [Leifsonia sp. Leaf264]|uniref:hypothetical protein n=1 Tax=Leifsonia sp. Leaf264 TaxID=1736314 RepID=UPI0006FE9A42|nr:hypothetical protein [Leifsonia sp. Leaf264]KQO98215.1 hypothetical protein ASF30_09140 [Leifsonia sp. Leaf264]
MIPIVEVSLENRLARLDEIAATEPGWYDGDGETPPAESVALAREILVTLFEAGVPTPGIFPGIDRPAVLVEWLTDSVHESWDVGSDGTVERYGYDANTKLSKYDVFVWTGVERPILV